MKMNDVGYAQQPRPPRHDDLAPCATVTGQIDMQDIDPAEDLEQSHSCEERDKIEWGKQNAAFTARRGKGNADVLRRFQPRDLADLIHDPVNAAHSPFAKRGGNQNICGTTGHAGNSLQLR
ncbi:hypothetical protein [Pararhizobium sp. LjRoot238]|uniref:hypothetical protein n=1 Tax=Pararhizobium sp. LjRoot238 TaxID=3342293 RepID=UPI003ECDB43F